MNEHRKRVITALIGASAIGACYYFLRHTAVIAITVIIALASYYEFLKICLSKHNTTAQRDFKIVLSLLAGVIQLLPIYYGEVLMFRAWALFLLIVPCVILSQKNNQLKLEFQDLAVSSFGLFYIVGFLCFIPPIHEVPDGSVFLMMLIFGIWFGDSGAYYGGKFFGKNKLASNISPKKTIEGSIAGLLSTCICFIVLRYIFLPDYNLLGTILLAILTALLSQLSDLVESLIKRAVEVKDSGRLLPGHGGMLDRFDSLILTAPFYYYFLIVWIFEL